MKQILRNLDGIHQKMCGSFDENLKKFRSKFLGSCGENLKNCFRKFQTMFKKFKRKYAEVTEEILEN